VEPCWYSLYEHFLWLKSRNKIFTLLAVLVVGASVLAIMPQQWHDRMATSRHTTRMPRPGRISARWTAYNLARTGSWRLRDFPRDGLPHVLANSKVRARFAQHLFRGSGRTWLSGSGVVLLLAWFTWLSAGRIIRRSKKNPETKWARIAGMVQVSMIGFAAAGAFLGMAYFDLYYGLIAIIVSLKMITLLQPAAATVRCWRFSRCPGGYWPTCRSGRNNMLDTLGSMLAGGSSSAPYSLSAAAARAPSCS
jgi:hypothetical protein